MSILIGSIVAVGFADNQNPEIGSGWLWCDGSTVSRTTYRQLFAAIGTAWGSGDGHSTFNLPDLRGIFVRGVNDGSGRDPDVALRLPQYPGGNRGDAAGSIQLFATALPASGNLRTDKQGDHSHAVQHLPTDSSWYEIAGSHYGQWNANSVESSEDGLHRHKSVAGGDNESRPYNVYVDYMIYFGTQG